MLINLSNHPHETWPSDQYKKAIDKYGSIFDLQFPIIDPDAPLHEVAFVAENYYVKIRKIAAEHVATVHLMGESTFCYQLLLLLKDTGIPCVASTTMRVVDTNGNGQKISLFVFHQFRPYF